MPLPFLIGAAAAAAVTAVAAVVLSDDSGSSSSYSDNEGDERRRAERERQERQLEEKMQTLDSAYEERLELDRLKLTSLLDKVSEVENMQQSMLVIEMVPETDMNPDGDHIKLFNNRIIKNKRTLDKFNSNIVFFESLYHGYIQPKDSVNDIANSIISLEEQVKKINDMIKRLQS